MGLFLSVASAGQSAAPAPAAAKIARADNKDCRVDILQIERLAGQRATGGNGQNQAGDDTNPNRRQHLSEDDAHERRVARSEGHADANLFRPERHTVQHHAENTETCQGQRHQADAP